MLVIRLMVLFACWPSCFVSRALLSSPIRLQRPYSLVRRLSVSGAEEVENTDPTKTRYTITCPPTDPLKLRKIVNKHRETLDRYLSRKPIAHHTQTAFDTLLTQCSDCANVILDSGCGTGRSSLVLGELYPQYTVLGVDRSIVRLCKQPSVSATREDELMVQQVAHNVWLVRADLNDFWRLLQKTSAITIHAHYVLYPNPYPKQSRIRQRWYGSPIFPILLQLSNRTIVRSNWDLYLQEFAQCAQWLEPKLSCQILNAHTKTRPYSNFEQKYWMAGEETYELTVLRCNKDDS